ncbi:hypothetical protein BSK48_19650 [Paenibacillus odorifer]|uniref:hypothetical protein n=1 Tax=Paenibacillus TaxID=44249 RepID=UPI00096C996F|nr:hypothetical protein [Paenibacillus odorifer]OMD67553.1 hypothetical protein BSK48_19650 [Paenibacillus odorifer]
MLCRSVLLSAALCCGLGVAVLLGVAVWLGVAVPLGVAVWLSVALLLFAVSRWLLDPAVSSSPKA